MCAFTPLTIRSLTLGLPWNMLGPEIWPQLKGFIGDARNACAEAGVSIRTVRLVLEPVRPEMGMTAAQLAAIVENVMGNAAGCGIRWGCLPISGSDGWQGEDLREFTPALIMREPALFVHFLFMGCDNAPPEDSLARVAGQVLRVSELSNNGFDNFRVGVGFNINADTPFFPFSWHEGAASFTFAVETLTLFKEAMKNDIPVIQALDSLCESVDKIGVGIQEKNGGTLEYRGQDISLAPYPIPSESIAMLMENMGLGTFGMAGTATVTSRLTCLLKSAIAGGRFKSSGFNGVMISPLEDTGIAKRMAERNFCMDSFLLWSTLCGCGVDMVPIPGNTPARSIAALYADTATLSRRHEKPLGARLLPIPGRRANQMTQFNHDFLVNTPIVEIGGSFGKI